MMQLHHLQITHYHAACESVQTLCVEINWFLMSIRACIENEEPIFFWFLERNKIILEKLMCLLEIYCLKLHTINIIMILNC